MYQNYIFDLYGTLVDIRTNERKRSLWEKLAYFYSFHGAFYQPMGLKKEYLRICREEELKLSATKEPEIEITSVFQQLFQQNSVDADLSLAMEAGKVFRILSLDYVRLYDGVTELLDALRRSGKRIYLLSNAQRIFTEPEMKLLRIYDCFDGIVFSSDEGCKKPSPDFYQVILDRYQLDRKVSIMIGNDAIADIRGAQGVGLDTLYIHSNISPEVTGEVGSNYSIMDGDFKKIQSLILK